MTNKTKIVATIGPASNNKSVLEKLISVGEGKLSDALADAKLESYYRILYQCNSKRSVVYTMNIYTKITIEGDPQSIEIPMDLEPEKAQCTSFVGIGGWSPDNAIDGVCCGCKGLPADPPKGDGILNGCRVSEIRDNN